MAGFVDYDRIQLRRFMYLMKDAVIRAEMSTGKTIDITADEIANLGAARVMGRKTHTTIFDDFTQAALDTTDNWLAVAGATASIGSIVASPEGKFDMICGTNGAAGVTDCAAFSSRVITDGSLVSLGTMVFEARVSTSAITGATICIGLSDKICSGSAEAVLHTVKTATIADDGLTVDNALSFCQDSEATNATKWYATSENGGTIAHTSAAGDCVIDVGPTADTYQIFTIEVDKDGTARWYVDDALKFTEETAVETTAILVPYLAVTAEDGTPVATTVSTDYIYFAAPRNPSNAA